MNFDYDWYKKQGKELAQSVTQLVDLLRRDQSYRQEENFRHIKLYGNMEAYTLKNYGFYRAEPTASVVNRVTLNVVQSMVDTVVSKLTKNKPRPSFLTDGGDWSVQRKAKKLTQFIDGQFYSTDFYSKRAICIQDSAIFGTGALKIYRNDNKICSERVFIDELSVDENEALYGDVRTLYQVKWLPLEVLQEMFPDKKVEIQLAGSPEISEWASNTTRAKVPMIKVYESWRLPSTPTSKDGKHAICIATATLFEEKWTKDYFPFVFWRWTVRPIGFWGQGVAEQLTGIQLEINKILRTIQISMHLVSVPKIFVEASSKVVESHLNNKIGGIIKYVGQPPIEGKLGTVPPELFNHLDRLYSRAYEVVGVSQLAAQATKPQGLNSGKALREYNDIESERFMSVAQRDEAAVLQAAAQYIDLAKEIYEEYGEFKVKTKGNRFMETLDWADVDLEADQYIMQCFPVSALSKSPAGRLQDVQELMGAGLIGREDGMKLLDFPDLQQFYNFNNAGLEDIERTIEEIIDKGLYSTPEPYQNLQLGVVKMQQAYLLYKSQGAPEERLELFRRWIEDAQTLLNRAAQEQVNQQRQVLEEQAMAEDVQAQQQATIDQNVDVQAAPEPGVPVPPIQ
jgi:hypothetical protein